MDLPNNVFVDTSFFIALLNSDDADHEGAVLLQAALAAKRVYKITSEYILLELCDGLAKLRHRELVIRVVKLLQKDPAFDIIPTSRQLWDDAWMLFSTRPDKEWGLTDCTSFVLMRQLGLNSALTTDRHFQQAGFRALLIATAYPAYYRRGAHLFAPYPPFGASPVAR